MFLRSSLPNCPEYQYADQSAPFPRQNHRAHGGGPGAGEQANFDAANKAKAAGADVVKQWSAVLDGKTRDTHRKLDHQIREMDKPFETHGKKAMYPHDFGDPAEDCNCRCTLLTRARAALDADELKVMQERAEFFGLDKTESFAEFKKKYLKAATETGPEEKTAQAKPVMEIGKAENQQKKTMRKKRRKSSRFTVRQQPWKSWKRKKKG